MRAVYYLHQANYCLLFDILSDLLSLDSVCPLSLSCLADWRVCSELRIIRVWRLPGRYCKAFSGRCYRFAASVCPSLLPLDPLWYDIATDFRANVPPCCVGCAACLFRTCFSARCQYRFFSGRLLLHPQS